MTISFALCHETREPKGKAPRKRKTESDSAEDEEEVHFMF
jgi:hypothetical protein